MATDRTIDLAKALHRDGRTAEAETLYREVLTKQPNALEALEGLGVLVFQRGNAAEASALFARGVAIDPSSARSHANLGEALRMIGRLDDALVHLRKALTLDPSHVQAWNSLGRVAFDARRYAAADHAYREAIRLRPRFVHAYINRANALVALGRVREARDVLRDALQIEPNNPVALMNLGAILSELNDPGLLDQAEAACRRAVSLAPQVPMALTALAKVLRLKGRAHEAVEFEDRAAKRDPARQVMGDTGRAGAVSGATRGDATAAHIPAEPGPSCSLAEHSKGMAYLEEGRIDEAEHSLRAALRLDPESAASWVGLARVQAERGDLELSCQSARAALSAGCEVAEAYWRLASNSLGLVPGDDVLAMERMLSDESLSNDDRALVHFALATVFDRRSLYLQASAHHESANLHQSAAKLARGLAYSPDEHTRFIDRVITAFSADFLAARRGWGMADRRPVFVVGFPRSGTTLTEQILAAHPEVKGAGELHDLTRIFQALPEIVGLATDDPFVALGMLAIDTTAAMAERYLRVLDNLATPTDTRVVDKMTENVNLLGLIALLFPEAKVIICRRDPRDIAASCWQTSFRSCPWNNDFDHIARRVADYQRVLRHWRRVQPLPCLEIQYEAMVVDLEHHARLLVDFVGLDWDPACLEFHSSKSVVRTPSLVQVREPVHSRSSGRWRHYESALGPMFQAFERHGVELNDRD